MFSFFKSKKDNQEVSNITAVEPTPEMPLAFREEIREKWKDLAHKKELTSSDMAALHIYRALMKGEGKEGAIRRLKTAFRPIEKQSKIAGGALPWGALKSALSDIVWLGHKWQNGSFQEVWNYCTFASWMQKHEIDKMLELIKEIQKEKL